MLSLIRNDIRVPCPAGPWWQDGVVTCCVSFRQFHNGRCGLTGAGPHRQSKEVLETVGGEQRRGSHEQLQATRGGHLWSQAEEELVSDNVCCRQQAGGNNTSMLWINKIQNVLYQYNWWQLHLWQSPHPMPGLSAQCNQEFIEIDRGGLSCGWGSEVCRPCNLSLSRPDTAAWNLHSWIC